MDISIGLAFNLKENRGICKYICPVVLPLKLNTSFESLKIKGDGNKCDDCRSYATLCPMEIDIIQYHNTEQRDPPTGCSLCQICITVCKLNARKLWFSFDWWSKEFLWMQI